MAQQIQSDPISVVTPPPVAPSTKSGTITTPQGLITWTRSSDGSIEAEGSGQKLTSGGETLSDGSWQKHAHYAQTGQAVPYLTMEFVGEVAKRTVDFTLTAGSSSLTLKVQVIDAGATSGNATLSGTWNGTAVHWSGHVDLTANPLVGRQIAGWPAGAFATELQKAALFAPLVEGLAQLVVAPPPAIPAIGGTQIKPAEKLSPQKDLSPSKTESLAKAALACAASGIAGAETGAVGGLVTAGGAALVWCVSAAMTSLSADAISAISNWIKDAKVDPLPVPPLDLTPIEEPINTGPVTQTVLDSTVPDPDPGPVTHPQPDNGDPGPNGGDPGPNGGDPGPSGGDPGPSGGDPGPSGGGGGGAGCFVAGTPVHVGVGNGQRMPIEEIKVASKLASCDVNSGEATQGVVSRIFTGTSAEIVAITLHDETLRCTPRHRFFTNAGWVSAIKLSRGTKIHCLDGKLREVLDLSVQPAEAPIFNLEVDRHHTYFVGKTGYLVHNRKDEDPDEGNDGDDKGLKPELATGPSAKARPAG